MREKSRQGPVQLPLVFDAAKGWSGGIVETSPSLWHTIRLSEARALRANTR